MRKSFQISDDEFIDSHTHCGGILLSNLLLRSYPYSQDTMDLIRKMKDNKIRYSICFPFPIYDIAEKLITPELYNDLLANETKAFGKDALLPFAYIRLDDSLPNQIKHLEKIIQTVPFYGIKIYPPCDTKKITDDSVNVLLTPFLKEHNFPIIFHTSFSGNGNPELLLDYADLHPEIRIMLAHAARFNPSAFQRIEKKNNVFLDCSPLHMLCALMNREVSKHNHKILTLPYNNPSEVLFQLATRFTNQLIWGTDSPCVFLTNFTDNAIVDYSEQFSYENEIKTLRELPAGYAPKIANNNTLKFLFG